MNSNNTESDFSLLPPHVLAQIFNLVNFRQRLNAARTCRSWYFASCDPIISKNTRVTISHKLKRLDELHRPFGTLILHRVDFNEFVYHPEFFARFGQYIQELDFDCCNISFQQLIDCLILTPCLKTFAIIVNNEKFDVGMNLSEEQANAIKTNLQCIKSLKIGLCTSTCGADALECIMRLMPNVKSLNFTTSDYFCGYVYKQMFYYINLFSEGIHLNRLSIDNLDGKNAVNFFNDFSKITQSVNVRELVLGLIYEEAFDDNDFDIKFDKFCEKLSGVRILAMRPQGMKQLPFVCRHMTQLVEAYFNGMRNIKMDCIGNLRNLQKLTILCTNYFSGNEDELLGVFTKLHQLKDLRLDYRISEQLLYEICVSCTNLIKLKLSRMRTNKITLLFKNLVKLKVLHLSFFYELPQDFTVDYDITNLILLEDLEINNFTPGITIELLEKLPNLRPESLLEIRTKLQPSYVDPVLEDAFAMMSSLFG